MKRNRIPGLSDIIIVEDPVQIRAMAKDARIDRIFVRHPFLNGIILKLRLCVLSYQGTRFPHQQPRGDVSRAMRQNFLWELYNSKSAEIADGPDELDGLARWVKGEMPDAEPGVLVQEVLGSFFFAHYKATTESWKAAVTIGQASDYKNMLQTIGWFVSGRISRAKKLLGSLANNDLSCLHATTVAVHNIVAAVIKMKALFSDEEKRRVITPESAADLCLSPPPVVFRQANSDGEAGGCPFKKYSMLLLKLGKADRNHNARDLVFMTGSWSRCPAEHWVPALLGGIWKRASRHKDAI